MKTYKITRAWVEGAMNYRGTEIISCENISYAEKYFFKVVTNRLKELVSEGATLCMSNQSSVFRLKDGTNETWFLNEVNRRRDFDWDLYDAEQR